VRTTVNLDDDVAAAVERLRRDRGLGVSSAVNELVRVGLAHGAVPKPRFAQRTSSGGARLDVTDVADVLDLLDGPGTG
jgi:hypothetical protein